MITYQFPVFLVYNKAHTGDTHQNCLFKYCLSLYLISLNTHILMIYITVRIVMNHIFNGGYHYITDIFIML